MRCIKRLLAVVFLAVLAAATFVASAAVPRDAAQYQNELSRQAKFYWGVSAPIATFAAQIHQESGWRTEAKSKFASGLAQFTPDTAKWISGAYGELSENAPTNPAWALRALVLYDLQLWNKITKTASSCDRMAMTLSAYNGGPGWVSRDRDLARAVGADPARWFGHVEHYTRRAEWAKVENRDYPRKILTRWQQLYSSWGPGVSCSVV